MKKISTLIIVLVAATLAMNAQPLRKADQAKARFAAAAKRLADSAKPNRLTEEDIMAACPDSIVDWTTNEDGVLAPATKVVFTYDVKKRVITETEYNYNDDPDWGTVGWKFYRRTTNSYNSSNQVSSATIEDPSDPFGTGFSLEIYTYDNAGRLVSTLCQQIDKETYTNYTRETITYDAQGRMTETLKEQWTGDSWGNQEKETVTYEGDKACTTQYDWEGALEWVVRNYSVVYNNAQGMPYREEAYEQDEETGEFILAMVTDLIYGANGLPESMKMYFNMGEGELKEMGSGSFTYEFNAQGLPTKVTGSTKIDYFGWFTEESTSVTYYYYGDGAHVDAAAAEPVVTSRRFYGMDGKETTGANRGLYIVVTEYADGTRTTVKSVRR
ncbi:MAG: hypothetical protein J6T64_06705 [Bacteroidaceae bacterium]|nr:hypothetical protein [Bacteroidaceae bacterium]